MADILSEQTDAQKLGQVRHDFRIAELKRTRQKQVHDIEAQINAHESAVAQLRAQHALEITNIELMHTRNKIELEKHMVGLKRKREEELSEDMKFSVTRLNEVTAKLVPLEKMQEIGSSVLALLEQVMRMCVQEQTKLMQKSCEK